MLNKTLSVLILFSMVIFLSSCKEEEKIKIIVPYGSTHISQVHLMEDPTYDVELVLGPDPLIAAFGSETHDVIFAPLTLGVKMYQAKPSYKLLATIIQSTFYMVTLNEEISDIEDLNGRSIILFGKNQTGDMITSYVLDEMNIEVSITYVDTLSDAALEFMRNTENIVLLSEPVYSKMLLLYEDLISINIMNYYEDLTDLSSVPQAAVFVHERLKKEQVSKLFDDLQRSVDLVYEDHDLTIEKIKIEDPNLEESTFIKSLENSYISLNKADINQLSIHAYLELVISYNPQIIGGSLPLESFYWK